MYEAAEKKSKEVDRLTRQSRKSVNEVKGEIAALTKEIANIKRSLDLEEQEERAVERNIANLSTLETSQVGSQRRSLEKKNTPLKKNRRPPLRTVTNPGEYSQLWLLVQK